MPSISPGEWCITSVGEYRLAERLAWRDRDWDARVCLPAGEQLKTALIAPMDEDVDSWDVTGKSQ